MNRLRKCFVVGVLVTAAIGLLAVAAAEEATFVLPENLPPLQTPILVTTCGQSPGALMFTLICNHLGLDCTEMDLLTLAEFQSQCDPSQPTQWAKVLVITTGTRLKGMGAAGVDVDSEVARCLGTCGLAPVLMVNEDVHAKVTPDKIPLLLQEYIDR